MNQIIDLANRRPVPKDTIDYWTQHTIRAMLWPDAWKETTVAHPLHWTRLNFSPDNAKDVPKAQGVYALSISIKDSIMPTTGTLVYFGKASSLQRRYREYVADMKRGSKRPKMDNLFSLWPDDLDFIYAIVDDKNSVLEDIEKALNDAVIPECVITDFSAEIRRLVKIFRK